MKKFIYVFVLMILSFPLMVMGKDLKEGIHFVSGDGTHVGDKICFGREGTSSTKDTQCFYVINNDGKKIDMLAEYNLKVGHLYEGISLIRDIETTEEGYNLQMPDINPTLRFANSWYWTKYEKEQDQEYIYAYDSNSVLYNYVEEYVNYLTNNYKIDASGKLLSYEQAKALGCSKSSCADAPAWVYSSSYWLGSVKGKEDSGVWVIKSSNVITNVSNNLSPNTYGARPVVTVDVESMYIPEADNPNTSDNMGLYLSLGLISSFGLLASSIYINRKLLTK